MLIPPVPSIPHLVRDIVPGQKRFTTRRASFPHAAWLGQGSPHCPISPTAASRRSLARVSVPVWGTVLSDPLPIVGSVGRHPADYLMGRMPVPSRVAAFTQRGCPPGAHGGLPGVSTGYPPGQGGLHTRYAPVRHSHRPRKAGSRPTCMY